jgi:hypothetical protein
MRAYAAAHLAMDQVLEVRWPDAVAFLQSEFVEGPEASYPVTILGEARGQGDSPEAEQQRLGNAIDSIYSLIALAGNAAVATPLAIAAYGSDLSEPRPFMGYRTPQATEWFPPGARRLDFEATQGLIAAAVKQPNKGPLWRAINGYRDALGYWTPETELLAGEFLYVVAETLSRYAFDQWKLDPVNAAKIESLRKLKGKTKKRREDTLRRGILRDAIFAGDSAAFAALEKASNGFEHGYMEIADIVGLLEPVVETCFAHVRRALLSALGVEEPWMKRLLTADYEEPRGLVQALVLVTGKLRRQDPTQPLPEIGGMAVELDWGPLNLKPVPGIAGKVNIELSPTITLRKLPDNASLDITGYAMRAAHVSKAPEQHDDQSDGSNS